MNRKRVLIIVVVVAAIVAGVAYSSDWFRRDSSLQGSGTVEARDIRVGRRLADASTKCWCAKATPCKAGQVLITFDDKELQAALDQSRAAAEKARRGYRPEEIAEARAALEEAKAEYEMRQNGYRREDIAAAQAGSGPNESRRGTRAVGLRALRGASEERPGLEATTRYGGGRLAHCAGTTAKCAAQAGSVPSWLPARRKSLSAEARYHQARSDV